MTAAFLGWWLLVWCIAGVLLALADHYMKQRHVGRHGPARDTATLPDLMKEH